MAKYKTKIIADKKKFPVLLANGNLCSEGVLRDGRHWKTFDDPFRNRLICLRSSQQSLTIPKILLKPNQGKSQNSQFLLSLENST